MVGIFIVGCFITAIVSLACWLVVTGIREDMNARAELPEEKLGQSNS